MTALLRLSAGLIGWAAAFCVIYGLHGIGCARGWDRVASLGSDLHRVTLVAAWFGCAITTLLAAIYLSCDRATSLGRAAMATSWTGFAATLVTFVPILLVPACL